MTCSKVFSSSSMKAARGRLLPDDVGDRVGVGGLEDVAHPEALEDLHEPEVEADGADHAGVVDLHDGDLGRAGDHLDAGLGADVVLGDERARVVRLEGVLEPDGDAGQLHGLGGLGVDGLHADVGELVGHVVVGEAHHHGVAGADDLGVGRGEVELLVDDRLVGLELHRHLAEGDLGVAAVELPHDALDALGVAGDHHHLPGRVDALERLADALVDGERLVVVEAGEVEEQRLDPLGLEDLHAVEGAVGLADGGQHLAAGQQDVLAPQVAGGQDVVHRVQVLLELGHALLDEGVGHRQGEPERLEALVDLLELAGERRQRARVVAADGELGVDALLTGLLVLEEPVGHAGVGRDHVDPAVDGLGVAQHDVLQHLVEPRHRGAADLLDGDHGWRPVGGRRGRVQNQPHLVAPRHSEVARPDSCFLRSTWPSAWPTSCSSASWPDRPRCAGWRAGPAAPPAACAAEGRGVPPRHWLGCAADPGPPRGLSDEERLLLGLPPRPEHRRRPRPGLRAGADAGRSPRRWSRSGARGGPFAAVEDLRRVSGIGREAPGAGAAGARSRAFRSARAAARVTSAPVRRHTA